jgi:hypothetical protein
VASTRVRGKIDRGQNEIDRVQSDFDPGQRRIDRVQNDFDPGQGKIDRVQNDVEPGQREIDRVREDFDQGRRKIDLVQQGLGPGRRKIDLVPGSVERLRGADVLGRAPREGIPDDAQSAIRGRDPGRDGRPLGLTILLPVTLLNPCKIRHLPLPTIPAREARSAEVAHRRVGK